MNVLRVKDGVQFGVIAPGGFAILAALRMAAQTVGHDLTITSGTDGEHSGPDDPHHRGEAYDIRTHDLPDATQALEAIQAAMPDYENRFYAFLEDPSTDNEHIHCQIKRGTTYP